MDPRTIIFGGWAPILRTLILGVLTYASLILFLRVSGKRTLSKMNAFDLVVTVALGSTLATILLSKDVSLLQGLTSLGLLIIQQFIIAWLSVRSKSISGWVKSKPALLFYQGRFLEDVLRKERVTEEEVRAAIRSGGISEIERVEAIILESDGSFSVLGNPQAEEATSLKGVKFPKRG